MGTDLVLSIAGTSDSVTLQYYFWDANWDGRYRAVQEVRLSSGAAVSMDALAQLTFGGSAASERMGGTNLADLITGLAGDDTLLGGAGDDTLDGGAGADLLYGESGNNTYRFGLGDGADVIWAWDSTPAKTNVLELKAGVALADLRGARVGDDLVLSIAGTADSVTVKGYFDGNAGRRPIQEVRLSTGAVVNVDALISAHFVGTAAADLMEGTALADVMSGLAGADRISGSSGDDRLDGGADNDTLEGGDGNDSLEGGAGADSLDGGTGNNTYRFGRGDGADVISAFDATATRRNVLELKAGVVQADLRGARVGNDLVVSIIGTTDSMTLRDFFRDVSYRPVQEMRFADGTELDPDALVPAVFLGSAEADVIQGTAQADAISGLAGADRLSGNGGDDRLDGGADNDTLEGGDGNDTLEGASGADTLSGGTGNNTFRFGSGDGADVIENDNPTGTAHNVLELKAGVAQADLRATRVGLDLVLSIAGTADSVTLRNHFNYSYASYRPVQEVRLSNSTVLSGDALTQLTFAGSAVADRMDGTALADVMTGLGGADTLYGNAGNDSLDGGADNDWIFGQGGNDSLIGGAGNDTLDGDAGDDTLDGGAGADRLDGGTGNNTYHFGRGDGADVISASDWTATKKNVLELKAGVALADLRAVPVGDDLVLSIVGTSDSVTLSRYFYDLSRDCVQELRFADGTVQQIYALLRPLFAGSEAADEVRGGGLADALTGLAGADSLYGAGGNDTLDGGADNDLLDGGDGDDILDGGAGNDTLKDRQGSNTFLFGQGDGTDVIDASYGRNVLSLKAGVSPVDLRFAGNSAFGHDLVVG
ncbi:MAG: calcium-binding protein, partial [Cereibacter sp.]